MDLLKIMACCLAFGLIDMPFSMAQNQLSDHIEHHFRLFERDLNKLGVKNSNYGIIAHGPTGNSNYYNVEIHDVHTGKFLYGFSASGNTNSKYENTSYTIGSHKKYKCYYYECDEFSVEDQSNDLGEYKNRVLKILKHERKKHDHSFLTRVSSIPVKVIIKAYGGAQLGDIDRIKLPGILNHKTNPPNPELTIQDFSGLQYIKGINFTVRPVATNSYLDNHDPTWVDAYSTNINITEVLGGGDVTPYQIAVPRKIKPDTMKTLPCGFSTKSCDGDFAPNPRSPGSFTTNFVIYPHAKKFRVIYHGSNVTEKLRATAGSLTVQKEGDMFKAMVNGTERTFSLYEITTTDFKRVIVTHVDEAGPFPAVLGDIKVRKPEINPINKKMRSKSSLASADKNLVAWHRGFWRDAPENTLQSIDAASAYLSASDMLELDVSRAGDLHQDGVYNYVLYHDPFMFRQSGLGPNKSNDRCIDPYDRILVVSDLLFVKQRTALKNTLIRRFPGYTSSDHDNWIKAPSDFTLAVLQATQLRDRFGCLTDITIPSLDEGIQQAKTNQLAFMVDKGWDDIDGIYWHAILNDYENNVYFKGGDNRNALKLTKMYGNELFQQIVYTPFYFDNKAQDPKKKVTFLEDFITKETFDHWIVPGFELQVKMKVEDGSVVDDGFKPDGVARMLAFGEKYRESKWIGITQINPTAYNGFDNKIVFMNASDRPKANNPYSSRFDRRADLMFNMNYLKCDYWTTDRPDVVVNFLNAIK